MEAMILRSAVAGTAIIARPLPAVVPVAFAFNGAILPLGYGRYCDLITGCPLSFQADHTYLLCTLGRIR